jgi:hypothetical protein
MIFILIFFAVSPRGFEMNLFRMIRATIHLPQLRLHRFDFAVRQYHNQVKSGRIVGGNNALGQIRVICGINAAATWLQMMSQKVALNVLIRDGHGFPPISSSHIVNSPIFQQISVILINDGHQIWYCSRKFCGHFLNNTFATMRRFFLKSMNIFGQSLKKRINFFFK